LSSDQINNKNIVLEWSKKTLYNLENDLPIPRMYFPHIPKNINEFQTKTKKNVFLSILLPISLRGNELVLEERSVMKAAFSSKNIYKIEYLAKKYKVKDFKNINFSNITTSNLSKINKELSIKINKIPISLILAQSIIESGWGSSRFAQEGNALFGQWTWSGEGLKPKDAEKNKGHKVMKFNVLQASVRAYQRNLNTHSSYKNLRKARAELRDQGLPLDSLLLVKFLNQYAETGEKYVEVLQKIIKQNSLKDFDDAKLLPSSIKLESLI
jgi:Bax protein